MSRPRSSVLVALAGWLLAACASQRDEPAGETHAATTITPSAEVAASAPAPAEAASIGIATSATALASASSAPPPLPVSEAKVEEPGDRIYAKARFVWIHPAPGQTGWIGYLTLGGSVRLLEGSREKAKTAGHGCDAWYRVEPRGYVCLGPNTTLDPSDPDFVVLKAHAGKPESPFPFEYGESTGTPRYFGGLPSLDLQRRSEPKLDEHLASVSRWREGAGSSEGDASDPKLRGVDLSLANVPFPALPKLPSIIHENRRRVAPGSTVAWSNAYDDENGRTWLYNSDHALVPKDRVRPYPKSTFQGVRLDDRTKLPIAFFRAKDRPKLEKKDGAFAPTGASFSRLSWVGLTGKTEKVGKDSYAETTEAGVWILERDAAIVRRASRVPFLKDELPTARRTWLDISVLGGTLVAYEDDVPVFATLIAPGRGGTPFAGRDPVSTASTPTGTFRVDGKFRWATMVSSSDSNIVHAEVQWVQNFHGPHALHGAYWHDSWGELMSGGCVNLSPIDSKWVFEWTEPTLPPGWHGLRSVSDFGPATRVVVRP